jgi:hypothetical protein
MNMLLCTKQQKNVSFLIQRLAKDIFPGSSSSSSSKKEYLASKEYYLAVVM